MEQLVMINQDKLNLVILEGVLFFNFRFHLSFNLNLDMKIILKIHIFLNLMMNNHLEKKINKLNLKDMLLIVNMKMKNNK
ncbi:unnamed protein product [Paramecium pentaurelia]|uniref:Uncharacterized protein n=1 Tax=Paramecium pentaurelia TaxID=43138 RepID=A0A8S1SBF4_9CILI|nr:unnamed protein product [Paramecium pentaurelia]